MLFVDFPAMREITPKAKQENVRRTFTGGVRIGNGMYCTDEQTRKYQKYSLQRKLP